MRGVSNLTIASLHAYNNINMQYIIYIILHDNIIIIQLFYDTLLGNESKMCWGSLIVHAYNFKRSFYCLTHQLLCKWLAVLAACNRRSYELQHAELQLKVLTFTNSLSLKLPGTLGKLNFGIADYMLYIIAHIRLTRVHVYHPSKFSSMGPSDAMIISDRFMNWRRILVFSTFTPDGLPPKR